MSTFEPDVAQSLYGRLAFDQDGIEIGEIEAVYLDTGTGAPEWAAVRTGRTETSLAPLAGSVDTDAGVQLAVDRRMVQRAPHGDDDGRFPEQLSEEQEAELYHYYSVEYTAGPAATGATTQPGKTRRGTVADRIKDFFEDLG